MDNPPPAPVDIPVAPAPDVDTHQLDKLPTLESEPKLYLNPYLWLVILYFLANAIVIAICGMISVDLKVADPSIAASFVTTGNTFISSSTTFFTVVAGCLGAASVAKKSIYTMAASKNGISTNVADFKTSDGQQQQ